MKQLISSLLLLVAASASAQQVGSNPIRVNQIGYSPTAEKVAVVEQSARSTKYTLLNANGKKVWSGKAIRTAKSTWSGKEREIVDFSSVKVPGEYKLVAGSESQSVVIKSHPYEALAKASMQAFYLQRTAEPILAEYAGVYARPAAHPDTVVYVHPSAASNLRPAGTVISSPGGWYDAGDFNKYIVNSGFSIGLMLSAYEMCPDYFKSMKLNIPESKNNTPDYLDEMYVNLKWMLTMQDPEDGGVYHKLTTPSFEGFVMPVTCKQKRYVVYKTVTASLDFAATMAKASRIYGQYPEYKEFAATALRQAEMAFRWATEHPTSFYYQDELNKKYEPAVTTGAYDDKDAKDEFFWASAELALATMNSQYINNIDKYMPTAFAEPVWGEVSGLGIYTAIGYTMQPDAMYANEIRQYISPLIIRYADRLLATVPSSCYQSAYGNQTSDFAWGCIAEKCCGQGIALLYAYRLTKDKKYLDAAMQNADYMLGRNALGYCYVTGFGTYSPKHPHQRLSAADGIDEPLPGFLVGGPNPGQQDKANVPVPYPSTYPDESYLDHESSYASNEIAINWNASLAAFIGWLDAEMK